MKMFLEAGIVLLRMAHFSRITLSSTLTHTLRFPQPRYR